MLQHGVIGVSVPAAGLSFASLRRRLVLAVCLGLFSIAQHAAAKIYAATRAYTSWHDHRFFVNGGGGLVRWEMRLKMAISSRRALGMPMHR